MRFIRYLFLSMYLLYAVSPLVGNIDKAPLGGITADRTSVSLRLLIVDRILSFVLDEETPAEADEEDVSDDFLVRKFRGLPAGHSLAKQISSESHTSLQPAVEAAECPCEQQSVPAFTAVNEPAASPFDGYGSRFSGLAPPLFFS